MTGIARAATAVAAAKVMTVLLMAAAIFAGPAGAGRSVMDKAGAGSPGGGQSAGRRATRQGVMPRPRTRIRRSAASRWSKEEIIIAKARCASLLRGIDAKVVPLAPIRRRACGAPAPVKLISIGTNPRVTLSPAPIVNCAMVAAMHRWVKRDLQPMARKYLRAPITSIEVMSSYSCRNAYGRRNGRLSQHARANALDIRGFAAVSGIVASVPDNWGPTSRKLKAMARAASRAASRAATRRARRKQPAGRTKVLRASVRRAKVLRAQERPLPGTVRRRPAEVRRNARLLRSGKPAVIATRSVGLPGGRAGQLPATGRKIPAGTLRGTYAGAPPGSTLYRGLSRLGGPGAATARPASPRGWRKSIFLRAIHKRACSIFGTVMGPEANHAHRHHFHLDLATRRLGPYCR